LPLVFVGIAGPAGKAGPAGSAGPAGAAGSAGPQRAVSPIGLTGAQGLQGEIGPEGAPGSMNNTATCFSYAQLAHLIEQIIILYPTSQVSVYTTAFFPNGVTGTPYQLFS